MSGGAHPLILLAAMLPGNQLTGAVPAEIGLLDELVLLVLASNKFTGTIPASVFQLGKLRMLNLVCYILGSLQSCTQVLPGGHQCFTAFCGPCMHECDRLLQ